MMLLTVFQSILCLVTILCGLHETLCTVQSCIILLIPQHPSQHSISHRLFISSKRGQTLGFPGGASGKEPTCQCRRSKVDPWVRKTPWRRKWRLTCLDREDWWATVHGVSKSRMRLKGLPTHACQALPVAALK